MCFYNTSVTLLGCTWNKVLSEGRQLLEEADLANLTEFSVFLILLLLCRICVEKYKTVCTNSRSWSLASKWIHCAKDTKEVRCSGRIWASRTPEIFFSRNWKSQNFINNSWNWLTQHDGNDSVGMQESTHHWCVWISRQNLQKCWWQ